MKFSFSENCLAWLESILSQRLGLSCSLSHNGGIIILELEGLEGRIEFDQLQDYFLDPKSELPCSFWDPQEETWQSVLGDPIPCPGVSKLPFPLIEKKEDCHLIHYDVLGLIYWSLNRIEEIGSRDLDEHQRFPASSSHAFRNGYLERPIVDEWIHILGQVIQRQWPDQKIKLPTTELSVTCDVDYPFRFLFSWLGITKMFLGDFFKRFNPILAVKNLSLGLRSRFGYHKQDPFFYNIDWMMKVAEKNKCRMTFYFMAGGVHRLDGDALLDYPPVRSLLREICKRGHKIGLHPSYLTFSDSKMLKQEIKKMLDVFKEENIRLEVFGSRQHFLRWKTPETAENLALNKIDQDSSLGYADHVGFRSGTCFQYPMFNPITDRRINLLQIPLVLMDVSVIDSKYMNLDGNLECKKKVTSLLRKINLLGGNCSVLWHNSAIAEQDHYNLFESIFSELN